MLDRAPTTQQLQEALARAEAIAQKLAQMRDQAQNAAAVLEVDLAIERQKVTKQTQELEVLRAEIAALKKPDNPPSDPQE